MARNIDDIQRDIERTRRQLAGTLDELSFRTQPKNLVDDAKNEAVGKLKDEKVQKILIGVGVAVVGLVALGIARSRKRSNELKEIREYLASR